MARIRTIKPEIAAHEGLFDLEQETGLPIRFAWCMLFTVADREGRFKWLPRTLKAQICPHDSLDFSRVLDAWMTRGFVVKYRVKDEWFGWIPTFTKHQVINNRESGSDIPPIDLAEEICGKENNNIDACSTRETREGDASGTREVHALGEGKGKEGKERKEKEQGVTGREQLVEALPDWLPRKQWDAFVAYRKRMKKPLTDHAVEVNLRKLNELRSAGNDPGAVLDQTVANGWSGLFEVKRGAMSGSTGPHGTPAPQQLQGTVRSLEDVGL